MSLSAVVNPYQPIVGLTGIGLNQGFLYIGTDGSDPEVSPQTCYWDDAGTAVAAQPISIVGGYPMRLGTPARLYTAATYSIRVRDRTGSQVFYEAHAVPVAPALSLTLADLAALRVLTDAVRKTSLLVFIEGAKAQADGGEGWFQLTPGSSASDNGGTVIVDASGNRWLREHGQDIHLAWWGIDVTGGTANDAAIVACVTYAASFSSNTGPQTFRATSRRIVLPPGKIGYTGPLTISEMVSLEGAGSRATQLFALASTGNITLSRSTLSDTGSSYGCTWRGFSIHGNNIVTGNLLTVQLAGGTFDDVRVWWSLGDGWVWDNAQNCVTTRCDVSCNGNPTSVPTTGANMRFTHGAAGNTIIRTENSSPSAFALVFGGNTNDNVVIHGECEYYKGKFVSEYYPAGVATNPTQALTLADGSEGAQPFGSYNNKLIAHESSYYGYGQGRALPHLLLRNGSSIIVQDLDYIGDDSSGSPGNTVFCQFGPNTGGSALTNKIFMHGVSNVRGNGKVFYDANSAPGRGYVDIFGETEGLYTTWYDGGASGNTAEGMITTPIVGRGYVQEGGMRWPPTQIPSTDATTLDDYREGNGPSFGLAIGGSTAGITYAAGPFFNFTKVGTMVMFSGRFLLSSTGGLTGNLTLVGLPIEATTKQLIAGAVVFTEYGGVTLGAGNSLVGAVNGGTTTADINVAQSGLTSQATHAILNVGTTAMRVSGFYLSEN